MKVSKLMIENLELLIRQFQVIREVSNNHQSQSALQTLATIDALRRSTRRQLRAFRDYNSPFERRLDISNILSTRHHCKPTVLRIINLIQVDLRRSTQRNTSLSSDEQVLIDCSALLRYQQFPNGIGWHPWKASNNTDKSSVAWTLLLHVLNC